MTDDKDLTELINDGPKSKKFRDLIIWITDEIRVLANIDEKVRQIVQDERQSVLS